MTLLDLLLARELDRERGSRRITPSPNVPFVRY